MPLNYSKWEKLEVSDDSDIEGHPNVDKPSLIRWQQRAIQEKRAARNEKIKYLHAQIACNQVLLPRITEFSKVLEEVAEPMPFFTAKVEQLEKNPSRECPPGNDPNKVEHTYDGMMLSLLRQVAQDARTKYSDAKWTQAEKDEKVVETLKTGMKFHVEKLAETITNDEKELKQEEVERAKHITSEDIHDGFSNSYVAPSKTETTVPKTHIEKPKKTQKTKTTEYEVLNPHAVIPTATNEGADTEEEEEEEEEEGVPEMTPGLEGFSHIGLKDFQKSFEYIQHHNDVVLEGAADALLVAGFRAENQGKSKYAKQCVHQSLLLQYCDQLGQDGVGIFFKRILSGNKQVEKVFLDDLERTYAHLRERVRISKEEDAAESSGREQIQLVAESGDQVISFQVPDGPPPENIVLEGPGTEDMDPEEVRKALQMRWDVYNSFPGDLQEALKENSLQAVNKVLGEMDVTIAETVVQSLDMAGILNFAEGGIRDETAKGRAEAGLPPKDV